MGAERASRGRVLLVALLLAVVAGALVALRLWVDPEPAAVAGPEGPAPGMVTAQGVQGATITLGVILSSADALDAAADASVLAGHRYYWDTVGTREGWPTGWHVALMVAEPADPVEALLSLEPDVLGISLTDSTGSLVVEAARLGIPIAADNRLALWGNYPHVIQDPLGSTYAVEIANALYWAARLAEPPLVTPGQQLGLVTDGTVFGEDCAAGFGLVSADLELGEPAEHQLLPGSDGGAIASSLVRAGVPVVVVCTDPASFAGLLVELDETGFTGRVIGGTASYDDRLPALVTENGVDGLSDEAVGLALFENVLLADSPPGREDSRIAALIDELAALDPAVAADRHFLEGYRRAAAFDLLLRAGFRLGDLTRSGLLAVGVAGGEWELLAGGAVVPAWIDGIFVANVTTAPGVVVGRDSSPFGSVRVTSPLVAPAVEQWAIAEGWSP